MTDWVFIVFTGWLAASVVSAFDALISVINSLLLSPDVTVLPQVRALSGRSVWIVDTVFVLVFVTAGALTIFSGGDERARYGAKDLLHRAVVGFVAAHFSQLLCGTAIGLANAVTLTVAGDGTLISGDAQRAMRSHMTTRQPAGQLLLVVIGVLVVILLAAVAVSAISRFVLLLMLTAVAPLALGLHALPQTDPLARLWWRAYAGCLAVPPLQAYAVFAGEWMLLDPRAMLSTLGPTGEAASVLNLLLVVVLLWTAVRVPALMRRLVVSGSGGGQTVVGVVVRLLVTQQLGRALPRVLRGVVPGARR